MEQDVIKANAETLAAEMKWLAEIIDVRMKLYWGSPVDFTAIHELLPPDLSGNLSPYAGIINHYKINFAERIVLLLALAPHIQPHLLDVFFMKNTEYDRGFTEVGGIKGQNHGGFLPTGETAAFILAINNIEERFRLLDIFLEDHVFRKFNILSLNPVSSNEPFLSGAICLSSEYLSYFTRGISYKPDFSINFPAKRISTELNWEDLILDKNTLEDVMEISDWAKYGDSLLHDWEMKKSIKPGYRALFYGPPGTGKTLTASLLGKSSGLEVYRIDLSMVVSKFIGETEKNLASVFDQAERKKWILFFDEADALFGKRTQTNSSNDRYANQEVSYLLQRVEDFPGVVILATNLKGNLDEAFSRRFQTMVYFSIPGVEQRKQLWQNAFSKKTILEDKTVIDEIAQKYEMSGGSIINVTRYSSLMAMKRGTNVVQKRDIINGIRREFRKEGKTV
jgi:hypothetical protein